MHAQNRYPAGSTQYLFFDSFDAAGASVTMTGLALADIKVFKNGSVTQRTSTAGMTLLDTDGIDFDAMTGIHGISIDLNDNTDAGFYAVGSKYIVVIDSITIDGATVRFILDRFEIVAAEHTAGYPVVTNKVGTGTGEINLSSGNVPVGSVAANAITAAALAADAGSEIAAAMLAAAFEGAETFQDFLRLARAALYGESNGLETTTANFRDAADTKNRIVATVDANGNRSALTLDAT